MKKNSTISLRLGREMAMLCVNFKGRPAAASMVKTNSKSIWLWRDLCKRLQIWLTFLIPTKSI
jgi:hypothetical protein